ncbi:B-cell receptor CD22-like [Eucyclogobius newberryi]|uniref:B-cell receptor CD22-like n=1 Tax=Eucyclogobius newberryi TaxID=166745 RepID=UPI003B5B4D3B
MAKVPHVLLLCGLLLVCRGQHWAVHLPAEVLGLSSSCVLLPCTFSLPPESEPHLDHSCRAVWKRGSWSRAVVYDSGASADANLVQGNLTGNLQSKDCSSVFYSLPSHHYDHYYFRLECEQLKYNFPASVLIRIQDALPEPTMSPPQLEVEEGSLVTLNCTALAPCPSEAPVVEWSPVVGEAVEVMNMEGGSVSSVLNFSASHLHDGVTVSCSALYSRPAVNAELLYENSLTLHVLYRPKNSRVLSPGPVREGSPVTLSCLTDANPAVDWFTWYAMDGDQVTVVGSTQNYSTTASEAQRRFFCQVSNTYGRQNSSITHLDVQFPPKDTAVLVDPPGAVVEGSSVSLLCVTRSNPIVSDYSWFRDGQEQAEVRGAVLVWETADHSHSGNYHCEARNQLGQDQSDALQLDIQYPPRKTMVSSSPSGPVEDGSLVTLSCSTDANPSSVKWSWYRESGRLRVLVGHGAEHSLNVTKLSQDQYYCGALNVHGVDFSQPVHTNVTFAPEILPSSRCLKVLSQIRCTCDSQGNPGPALLWELSGERVNHSALTPITEEPLSSVRMRSTITLHALDQDMPSLVCHGVNALGSYSLVYNVSSSSHAQLGLHTLSLLVGSAAGALGMSVLCLPLLLFFSRKSKNGHVQYKNVQELSDTVIGNEIDSCKVLAGEKDPGCPRSAEGEELHRTREDVPPSHGRAGARGSIEIKEVNGVNGQLLPLG